MAQCFVPLCKNRSDCQNWKKVNYRVDTKKITFHRFPKNSEICKLWLDILQINAIYIPSTARICSVHFDEESLDRTWSRTRLKLNSLPKKILVTKQESNSNFGVSIKPSDIDQNPYGIISTDSDNRALSPISNISASLPLVSNDVNIAASVLIDLSNLPTSAQYSSLKVDKGTMVTPELVYNSPEKDRLRKRIKFLQTDHAKKMKLAQQKIRQYSDQVAKLKYLLNELKKKKVK